MLDKRHRAGQALPCWTSGIPCWTSVTLLDKRHRAGQASPCWTSVTVLDKCHRAGQVSPCWTSVTVLDKRVSDGVGGDGGTAGSTGRPYSLHQPTHVHGRVAALAEEVSSLGSLIDEVRQQMFGLGSLITAQVDRRCRALGR